MQEAEHLLPEVLAAFTFGGQVTDAVRSDCGHINDTFSVYVQPENAPRRHFILQRISAAAFHHPEQVMSNIAGVTAYLSKAIAAAGGDPSRETMTVVPTKDGSSFYTDSEGGAWRVYPFIEGTVCLQSAETPELFAASARAFGRFQHMLKDAVKADVMGRAKEVQPELDFVRRREADCSVALQALREGKLPLRVTHNDTKLNNVLIDRNTGEGICVIDLDTVMLGLSINDFGDSIRFGANHNAEDEPDLTKVNFDLSLYEVYTQGFLEGAGGALTPAELDYLPWGAKLMTLECGIRFLTDYLEGDHYFRIHREGQNLDRCRTQFKLVADMENQWAAMQAVVDKYR